MKDYFHSQASISEQAAEWLIELAECGDSGPGDERRREFMTWLKRSPQHIEEFLGIAMLEQELGEHAVPIANIVASLQSAGPAPPEQLHPNNAMPMALSASSSPPLPRARRAARTRRLAGWATAAGIALAATLLVPYVTGLNTAPVRHATILGEQRSVTLDDGSVVVLNTLSEVDIDLGRSQRRVALLAGEALFDVAPDSNRPFVVDAGDVSLTVLGTKFSVYRKGDETRLAVVEGIVKVSANGDFAALATPRLIRAGEGLLVSRDGTTTINTDAEVAMAMAWTEKRLIFNGAPLAEIVSEFNRYNAIPVIVEDGDLARRKITTVFKANDVDALVSFLDLEPGVDVQRDADAIRIRQTPRDPADAGDISVRE